MNREEWYVIHLVVIRCPVERARQLSRTPLWPEDVQFYGSRERERGELALVVLS